MTFVLELDNLTYTRHKMNWRNDLLTQSIVTCSKLLTLRGSPVGTEAGVPALATTSLPPALPGAVV